MKKALFISMILGLLLGACSKGPSGKSTKRQKTPSHLVMSQDEKVGVNYDQRENRKIVDQNLKNKKANMKAADKARQKQNAELNELNKNSSKVKRRRAANTAFNFY